MRNPGQQADVYRRRNQAGISTWRILALLLMLGLVALGIAAGVWQTRRAEEKIGIEKKLAAQAQAAPLRVAPGADWEQHEYRHLRVKGRFVAEWPLFLENRPLQNRVGFYVLMPFKLEDGRQILVARGWAPRDERDRSKLPQLTTPSGEIEIEGIIRRQAGRLMQLGNAPQIKPGAVLQNLEVAQLRQASVLPLQDYLLEQVDIAQAAPPDQLQRAWPAPASGVDKHKGYALQWFGLALSALVAFIYNVIAGIRRAKSKN